eukprot:CAMPEP_0116124192 /NCGR_PEP_ID=MMETSP0329-20121206/5153_1 /TAXON_ID=697910 /ORGANISM="Pseudo-nitzschia arenysensis, Strain B593" /LENGTH=375 /DNA_ID=CAMNT_0003618163 /DNA_START=9 /DNA_END=1133 /DNA_ORIENTATION=-
MMTLIENLPSIVVSITFTLGFLWLFYPAWAVLVAENLEWEVEQLPSSGTQPSELPVLSLVIPAYNEEERIPIMIRESFEYLKSTRGQEVLRRLQMCAKTKATISSESKRSGDDITSRGKSEPEMPAPTVEWLIINDGSKDSTCNCVREIHNNLVDSANRSGTSGDNLSSASSALEWNWKIVSLKRNGGKGAAVKTGMNLAEGMFHLMVDADGATSFGKGLENLTQELEAFSCTSSDNCESDVDPMIAIFGSRAHLQKESTAKRSFVRTLLMKAFHFFVSLFVSSKVHDTQCGFKLFSKSASGVVFKALHLRRWAFDTEIVLISDIQAIKICEVAVPWKEVDGSKLSTSKLALALVSISMLRDMICVRACYTLGIW